jgi:hypothetical protein
VAKVGIARYPVRPQNKTIEVELVHCSLAAVFSRGQEGERYG